MKLNKVGIKEEYKNLMDEDILSLLLIDRSSNKNIIWATNDYSNLGSCYASDQEIRINLISKKFSKLIRPRIEKNKKEQQYRIKQKAEVFTPSWICNHQNNLIDDAWFGYKNVFNTEKNKTWITNNDKIILPKTKTWKDYVKLKRIEISCGEAPYLVSRYDTVTGEFIDINNRIGLLDRKIRIINENAEDKTTWIKWIYKAFKTTYGFEWQGDNLLIARKNLLFSFIDYYYEKFKDYPTKKYLLKIAEILSWNLFQMDGLKFVIPNSCKPQVIEQMTLFNDGNEFGFNVDNVEEQYEKCQGCLKNDNNKHSGIYCEIMDWDKKQSIKFITLFNKGLNNE